jgi:hypothetical protein
MLHNDKNVEIVFLFGNILTFSLPTACTKKGKRRIEMYSADETKAL